MLRVNVALTHRSSQSTTNYLADDSHNRLEGGRPHGREGSEVNSCTVTRVHEEDRGEWAVVHSGCIRFVRI